MIQISFADAIAEQAGKRKKTRRKWFWGRWTVVWWKTPLNVVEPHYPKRSTWRLGWG